jgi:hypothetical protein
MTEKTHWLYRPENRPKLWAALFLILALSLLPSLFMHHHGHFSSQRFDLDTQFGFYAWFGFVTCAAMVAAAKVLGIFLKRDDRYYDD